MAQVPAPRLGEQIVPAVLKSSLVTPLVTDYQRSQAAMWAFFCRMLISSCALKGVGPPGFLVPVALPVEEPDRCWWQPRPGSHTATLQSNVQQLLNGIYPLNKCSTK